MLLVLLVEPLPPRALVVVVQISAMVHALTLVLLAAMMVGVLPLSVSCAMNLTTLLLAASNGSRRNTWACTMMVIFLTVSSPWRIMCTDRRDIPPLFLLILPGIWIQALRIIFLRRWRSCI
jgi:hypothetical protein